ncbi:MAG: ATP-binding protein [Actinobacteria bacterium]|nr:ATP-binding protein [Actinomycetota bacterium]
MDTQRYQHRVVDDELDELTPSLPALALEGPKGVGKTATASRRAVTIHRLDDPAQRSVALADPSRLVKGPPPVLIDEWQHVPESWDLVRRAVDDGAPPGRFFLTGSASPADLSTHSGAGRIVTVRMRPLALTERGIGSQTVSLRSLLSGGRSPVAGQTDLKLEAYVDEILASGFPGLRGLSGRALRAQLDSYLGRIVERDFEELGHSVRNPAALRRWMTAYAAASSTTASYETIRDAATSGQGEKPAKTATMPYRDVLERLWIVDAVPAWLPTRNRISRLSAPPKHQLADPALAARLLGVDAKALLDATPVGPPIPRDGTLLGALFESVVTLDLRVYAQAAEATVKHLRTHGGEHEIDLIVERADGRVVAVEVKLARNVDDSDVRHLTWLANQIGGDLLDAIIITTGDEAYRRRDGIAVIPAALLGP